MRFWQNLELFSDVVVESYSNGVLGVEMKDSKHLSYIWSLGKTFPFVISMGRSNKSLNINGEEGYESAVGKHKLQELLFNRLS